MSTRTTTPRRAPAATFARSLAGPAIGSGLVGGLLFVVVMIVGMGASGMGYASPLNLGMPAFVTTVAPPAAMMPGLMAAMGISLPPAAMAKVMPAFQHGYLSPAMAQNMGHMLTSMGVPAAKVQMMGPIMTGHADNATVAKLMAQMPPSAQHAVMSQMPVSASRIAVGSVLHFAFSVLLALVFFAILGAAAWAKLPGMRSRMGLIAGGMAGGVIVYVVNRWLLLPATNPMMAFVPQIAFFVAHLIFGLVVGMALALKLCRPATAELLP